MESAGVYRVQRHIFLFLSLSSISLLFVHHAGAAQARTPATLQEYLDKRCRDLFVEICQSDNKDFCDQHLDPVARKGLGTQQQNDTVFRCYDRSAVAGNAVDTSTLGVYCVDDCGNSIRCPGSVKRALGSFHATRPNIPEWIEEGKKTYCSSLQENLDKACDAKSSGSLGRFLGGTVDSPIACIPTTNLAYRRSGYCFNMCGFPGSCPGGAETGAGQAYVELSEGERSQLLQGFERPCRPYETCTQKPGEEVQCRTENEASMDLKDDLQHWLDGRCQSYIQDLCKSQPGFQMCSPGLRAVLRKGYGLKVQMKAEYRCYDMSKLGQPEVVNTSEYGVRCVDNCGMEVPCGGTVNVDSVMHVTRPDFESWIKEGKLIFCSPYQSALQSVCDGALPGSVARYGLSTKAGTGVMEESWGCAKSHLVTYEGVGTCMNNCGGPSSCAGGRRETGPSGDGVRLLSADEVEAAVKGVVPPCKVSEICSATPRNPPTCEPVEYEATPGGGGLKGTIYLEDGESLTTEFFSQQVTVKIGTCFLVEIDLQAQQVLVGSADRRTAIATSVAAPPSRLTLHRSGSEVTMTLLYNSQGHSNSSLFYVQPGAVCVATDPVVLEGLDEESQVTRSSIRSISSATQ